MDDFVIAQFYPSFSSRPTIAYPQPPPTNTTIQSLIRRKLYKKSKNEEHIKINFAD